MNKLMRRVLSGSFLLASVFSLYFASSANAQHEGHVQEHAPTTKSAESMTEHEHHSTKKKAELWTCSMHPQIRLPQAGQCPLCKMDLIPVPSGDDGKDDEDAGASLKLTDEALAMMDVQTSVVERKRVEKLIRLVGKVDYDETRLKHITSWVPGRVDRMYVDYTGISVQEGDHMVYLYSPELLSAQEELLQASRSVRRLGAGASKIVKHSSQRSAKAAREKLRLLGLTEEQVKEIESRGKAKEQITIYAPIGGVVVNKHVNEGMYVKTGTRIYTIADLSRLWVNLDSYESDLPWIRYGQRVEFTTQALPGETFRGIVSFVQPFLDEKSRTVRVRVNVENPAGRLKPGMFVSAAIKAELDSNNAPVPPAMSGKYICPMHPEVMSDSRGSCPVCGMDLVEAESLPFVESGRDEKQMPPLVIPASAPLITGKRAIVFVQSPDKSRYSAREIVLGPRAGDFYLVSSGLSAGEVVVTKGNFKIDADLQIQGKPSMMNPKGGSSSSGHAHGGHGA